jgi:hypothetical protein
MLQFGASLTDDTRSVVYNRNVFEIPLDTKNLLLLIFVIEFAPIRFGRMETESKQMEERLKAEEKHRKEETRYRIHNTS